VKTEDRAKASTDTWKITGPAGISLVARLRHFGPNGRYFPVPAGPDLAGSAFGVGIPSGCQ
jgi:hypothetical protein